MIPILPPTKQAQMQVSEREKEIIILIAFEHTTNEIANKLFLSESTIDTHRRRIFRKLKVKNAAGMVRRSFELGIITVGDQINSN